MRLVIRQCPSLENSLLCRGSLLAGLLVAFAAGPLCAQEPTVGRQQNAWGRFNPGAWKAVRTTTETLDERGNSTGTSVSETRTFLVAADKDGVTLEVQAAVEVAGKRFESEPQLVKQGYLAENGVRNFEAGELEAASTTIDDKKVACKAQQISYEGPASGTKTKLEVSFATAVFPHILRRHSTTVDAEGKTLSDTTVEVTNLEMPWKIHNHIRTAAITRTTLKTPKGTTITVSVLVPEVPGGVVSHTSKETDKNGRVIRRSTMELVDFGLECEEERVGPIGRLKRRPRHRDRDASIYTPRP